MTTNQLFFALVGVMGVFVGFLKYYIDAKIDGTGSRLDAKIDGAVGTSNGKFGEVNARLDSLSKNVDLLVNYMILHAGKIATLEERTKNL